MSSRITAMLGKCVYVCLAYQILPGLKTFRCIAVVMLQVFVTKSVLFCHNAVYMHSPNGLNGFYWPTTAKTLDEGEREDIT